jgi:hypothetical protein
MRFEFLQHDGPEVRGALELMQRRLEECAEALTRIEMHVSQVQGERDRIDHLLDRFESITGDWSAPLVGHCVLSQELLMLLQMAVTLSMKEVARAAHSQQSGSESDDLEIPIVSGSLLGRLGRTLRQYDEDDEHDVARETIRMERARSHDEA